jgi:hypothetical protein
MFLTFVFEGLFCDTLETRNIKSIEGEDISVSPRRGRRPAILGDTKIILNLYSTRALPLRDRTDFGRDTVYEPVQPIASRCIRIIEYECETLRPLGDIGPFKMRMDVVVSIGTLIRNLTTVIEIVTS